jgi:hypothetical protein
MAKNPLLLLSYATIIALWIASQKISIPYVAHLLLLVTAILYAACHNSLSLREEQALARGERPSDYKEPSEGEELEDVTYETLKASDAATFPLLGSASLFGLYCAFKYFDKDTVNLIISVYFCFVGCAALTASFSPILESLGPKVLGRTFSFKKKWNHSLPESIFGASPWKLGLDGNCADVLSFFASVAFCVAYFQKKHWTMNNVLGICFCLQGIERFSLGTYKIGATLLVGLFFYDIFWV